MKRHYADFALYALKNHFADDATGTPSPAEIANEEACKKVCAGLDERTQEILRDICRGRDTLADTIFEVSRARNMNQNDLWTLIAKVEKTFAQERGLI